MTWSTSKAPAEQALLLSLPQVSIVLSVSAATVKRLRGSDPTFPEAVLISGQPRIVRAELEKWAMSLPRGWSKKGGTRKSEASRG